MEEVYQQLLDSKRICKQFRTRWWRSSYSISSEKGKIMERYKELLDKRWRNPQDDPRLTDKPTEKLP